MIDEEFPKDVLPFEEEIKKYIDKYVLEEDKEAHVSTSSFYRHYKDKYDVMNDNYKRIIDQYMHSSQNHNYENVFINLFNMSKELHYLKMLLIIPVLILYEILSTNIPIILLLRCVK